MHTLWLIIRSLFITTNSEQWKKRPGKVVFTLFSYPNTKLEKKNTNIIEHAKLYNNGIMKK